MTPLIDLISSTWSSKRGEYELFIRSGANTPVQVWDAFSSDTLFVGDLDACTAWIDRQCAEAVAGVIVPAELVALSQASHSGFEFGMWVNPAPQPIGPFGATVRIMPGPSPETAFARAAMAWVRSLIPATTSETQP